MSSPLLSVYLCSNWLSYNIFLSLDFEPPPWNIVIHVKHHYYHFSRYSNTLNFLSWLLHSLVILIITLAI